MKVLDIDPQWRMHRVSDGQRRRVQICMGLLKSPEVQEFSILNARTLWASWFQNACLSDAHS